MGTPTQTVVRPPGKAPKRKFIPIPPPPEDPSQLADPEGAIPPPPASSKDLEDAPTAPPTPREPSWSEKAMTGLVSPEVMEEIIGGMGTLPGAPRTDWDQVTEEQVAKGRPFRAALSRFIGGTRKSIANLASSATSPVSLGTAALSGGLSLLPKAWTFTRAATAVPLAAAGTGFAGVGAGEALEPRREGEDTPAEIERRLTGASMVAGAPGIIRPGVKSFRAAVEKARYPLVERMTGKPSTSEFIPAEDLPRLEVDKAASAHGIEQTAGEASQSRPLMAVQEAGERALVKGGELQARREANTAKVFKWTREVGEKVDPKRGGVTTEATGEHLVKSTESALETTKKEVKAKFDSFKDTFHNVSADTTAIAAKFEGKLKEMRRVLQNQPSSYSRPIRQILDKARRLGIIKDKEGNVVSSSLTLNELQELRSNFWDMGHKWRKGNIPDRASALARELTHDIDQLMMETVKDTDPKVQAAFRDANDSYKAMVDTFDNPKSPLYRVMAEQDPSKIPAKITAKGSIGGSPFAIRMLKEQGIDLGPVKREVLGEIAKDGFQISGDKLTGYSHEFLSELFSSTELREIYTLSKVGRNVDVAKTMAGGKENIGGTLWQLGALSRLAFNIPGVESASAMFTASPRIQRWLKSIPGAKKSIAAARGTGGAAPPRGTPPAPAPSSSPGGTAPPSGGAGPVGPGMSQRRFLKTAPVAAAATAVKIKGPTPPTEVALTPVASTPFLEGRGLARIFQNLYDKYKNRVDDIQAIDEYTGSILERSGWSDSEITDFLDRTIKSEEDIGALAFADLDAASEAFRAGKDVIVDKLLAEGRKKFAEYMPESGGVPDNAAKLPPNKPVESSTGDVKEFRRSFRKEFKSRLEKATAPRDREGYAGEVGRYSELLDDSSLIDKAIEISFEESGASNQLAVPVRGKRVRGYVTVSKDKAPAVIDKLKASDGFPNPRYERGDVVWGEDLPPQSKRTRDITEGKMYGYSDRAIQEFEGRTGKSIRKERGKGVPAVGENELPDLKSRLAGPGVNVKPASSGFGTLLDDPSLIKKGIKIPRTSEIAIPIGGKRVSGTLERVYMTREEAQAITDHLGKFEGFDDVRVVDTWEGAKGPRSGYRYGVHWGKEVSGTGTEIGRMFGYREGVLVNNPHAGDPRNVPIKSIRKERSRKAVGKALSEGKSFKEALYHGTTMGSALKIAEEGFKIPKRHGITLRSPVENKGTTIGFTEEFDLAKQYASSSSETRDLPKARFAVIEVKGLPEKIVDVDPFTGDDWAVTVDIPPDKVRRITFLDEKGKKLWAGTREEVTGKLKQLRSFKEAVREGKVSVGETVSTDQYKMGDKAAKTKDILREGKKIGEVHFGVEADATGVRSLFIDWMGEPRHPLDSGPRFLKKNRPGSLSNVLGPTAVKQVVSEIVKEFGVKRVHYRRMGGLRGKRKLSVTREIGKKSEGKSFKEAIEEPNKPVPESGQNRRATDLMRSEHQAASNRWREKVWEWRKRNNYSQDIDPSPQVRKEMFDSMSKEDQRLLKEFYGDLDPFYGGGRGLLGRVVQRHHMDEMSGQKGKATAMVDFMEPLRGKIKTDAGSKAKSIRGERSRKEKK